MGSLFAAISAIPVASLPISAGLLPISTGLSPIPEVIGSPAVADSAIAIVVRLTKHRKILLNIIKHHETLVKHCDNIVKRHKTSSTTSKTS